MFPWRENLSAPRSVRRQDLEPTPFYASRPMGSPASLEILQASRNEESHPASGRRLKGKLRGDATQPFDGPLSWPDALSKPGHVQPRPLPDGRLDPSEAFSPKLGS